MKHFLFSLLLFIPCVTFAATQTIKVSGMMCSSCEGKVKKALKALPGVTEVTADAKTGAVSITVAEGKKAPTLDEIASITKDLGYKIIR